MTKKYILVGTVLVLLGTTGCSYIPTENISYGVYYLSLIHIFRIHQALSEIIKAMFITTNPIPVKYAARKIGLPVGKFNLPMCEPTADEAAYIDKALAEYLK